MPTFTLRQAIARRDAAMSAYAGAVKAFRAAWVELSAMDVLLERRVDGIRGFGEPINAVQLRHSGVNPDESGSLQADVMKDHRNHDDRGLTYEKTRRIRCGAGYFTSRHGGEAEPDARRHDTG